MITRDNALDVALADGSDKENGRPQAETDLNDMHDAAPPEPALSILGLLREAAISSDGEHISISDILHGMKDRAAAALILIFALPNVLPTPPGTSTVLGFPLMLICAQLATGLPVWLPRLVGGRSVNAPRSNSSW